MKKRKLKLSRHRRYPPDFRGVLEVSRRREGILIAGDPDGLRSLAGWLIHLAEMDQERVPGMPDGERYHHHLVAGHFLTSFSTDTELCRLDAKGTGAFPAKYQREPND